MADKELITLPRAEVQQALEALEREQSDIYDARSVYIAITALRERLAQPEQEPVAWLITEENINSLQANSIQNLIDRAKHAHHTDICMRINGQDEWFQADWLKHLTRTTPQPAQQPLIEISESLRSHGLTLVKTATGYDVIKLGQITAHGIKEQS